MNPLLKEREVDYYLGNSGAKLMFVWEGFADEAEAGAKLAGAEVVTVDPQTFIDVVGSPAPVEGVVDRDDEDTAVILYTYLGNDRTAQGRGADQRQPASQHRDRRG